ncbi:polymorphic toxin type 44 domain-containing protein [Shewanella sp. A3A]|nr:polymorphic toxin type 44 domain-containing protein [Shewanella ferrihydritica]
MKARIYASLCATLLFSTFSHAEAVDCVHVKPGSILKTQLNTTEKFDNCFILDDLPSKKLLMSVVSSENIKNRVSIFDKKDDESADYISDYVSSSTSENSISLYINKRKLGFSIYPKTYTTKDKELKLSYFILDGNAVVTAILKNLSTPRYSSGGLDTGHDTCYGERCYHPQAVGDLLSVSMAAAASSCSSAQKVPQDKNKNFNTNQHLKLFAKMGNMMHTYNHAAGGRMIAVSTMITEFWPKHGEYDFKYSQDPNVKSGSNYGNWFYGAVAQLLGLTETEALRAAAITQQFQDLPNDYGASDLAKMGVNMLDALVTGRGDNPDDGPMISGGYSYAKDIYSKDANRDSHSDSCNTTSNTPASGGSGESGVSGGWSSGVFIGGSCYGACGGGDIPSGSVTIIDFPYPKNQE